MVLWGAIGVLTPLIYFGLLLRIQGVNSFQALALSDSVHSARSLMCTIRIDFWLVVSGEYLAVFFVIIVFFISIEIFSRKF